MGALDNYLNQLVNERNIASDRFEDEYRQSALESRMYAQDMSNEIDSAPITLNPGEYLEDVVANRELQKKQLAADADYEHYQRSLDIDSRRQAYDDTFASKYARIKYIKNRGIAAVGKDAPGISTLRQEMVLDPATGQVSAVPKKLSAAEEDEVRVKEIALWMDLPEYVVRQGAVEEYNTALDTSVKLENIEYRRAQRKAAELKGIDQAQRIAERAEKARKMRISQDVEQVKTLSTVPTNVIDNLLSRSDVPEEARNNAAVAKGLRAAKESLARGVTEYKTTKERRNLAMDRILSEDSIKQKIAQGELDPIDLKSLIDAIDDDELTQYLVPDKPFYTDEDFLDDFGPGSVGDGVFNTLEGASPLRNMFGR